MLRIRLHGRGGHGMKTASRVLGRALFLEGYQVQDAPRYGAERRGAPIFAYVRADRKPILERGVIREPDLVVVADDSLVQVPAAGVRLGLDAHAVLLIDSHEAASVWQERLALAGPVFTTDSSAVLGRAAPATDSGTPGTNPETAVGEDPYLASSHAVGAAAALLGAIPRATLEAAMRTELSELGRSRTARALAAALAGYDTFQDRAGTVEPRRVWTPGELSPPDWISLPFETADVSAPTIHGGATSVKVRTGLWRTLRPVIDHEACHRCHWMCAFPCPDGAMFVDSEGYPQIDLDHCKGCMICVAQCPFHVIEAIPERAASALGDDSPAPARKPS